MLFPMTLTMVHQIHTYNCTDYSPTSNASKLTQSIQQHFSKTGSAPVFRLASKTCYYIHSYYTVSRIRGIATRIKINLSEPSTFRSIKIVRQLEQVFETHRAVAVNYQQIFAYRREVFEPNLRENQGMSTFIFLFNTN